jgi:Leucine-rich repeat (LRR) protein
MNQNQMDSISWPNSLFFFLNFYILLSTLWLTSATLTTPAICLASERSALLQLKEGFIDSNLTSWQPDTNCCHGWEGISCDKSTGHVINLDLSDRNIYGDLSEVIFNLTSLEQLNLANNNFSQNHIPKGFDQLSKLTHLNLSYSHFIGQIPIGISNLTNLLSLDLSSYYWGLMLHNPSLRTLIRNMSNLRELHLDVVNISENGTEWCGALSESVPLLRVLSMNSCNLTGPIEPSLSRLNSLAVIDLSDNEFNSSVPDYFADFPLKDLVLSSCGLIGIFPREIFHISTLTVLDLSWNGNLTLGTLPNFPLESSLESVNLPGTNTFDHIPNSIGNLRNLSYLCLDFCELSGRVPTTIGKILKLKELYLSFNSLSGSIPQSLFALPNLQTLDLSENNFTGQLKLEESSISFAPLTYLDLSNNHLNGSIPREIYKLSNLELLAISSNQFSGPIPREIYKLSNLVLLDISSNQFSGPIPNCIFKLSSLEFLHLMSNNFNGTVKLSLLQHLQNLTSLYLSNNQISIEDVSDEDLQLSFPKINYFGLASCNLNQIPRLLRYHDNLDDVDLSNNHLHGVIPSWIWEKFHSHSSFASLYLDLSHNEYTSVDNISICPALPSCWNFYSIDLSFNKIKGNIPLIGAGFLDYSNNEFSKIPSNYAVYLNGTVYLIFSTNSLTGEIPSAICEAPYIQFVDLSHNNFSGSIPSCIVGLPYLAFLNLAKNKLHGIIPHNISKTSRLVILDLSNNKLHGALPRPLMRCTYLMILALENNYIVDTFPFWLGKMPNLQVLILNSNQFHGTLDLHSKLATENSLFRKIRIISLASNNFHGSLPSLLFENLISMTNLSLYEITVEEFADHEQIHIFRTFSYHDHYGISINNKDTKMILLSHLASLMVEIDLSENNFSGDIPERIGSLSALKTLNLSHNSFTGNIPRAFKGLDKMESLDLSWNNLFGEIPQELASLDSLSTLNLSFNHLAGRIPQSPHFSTFDNSSFVGNLALCGMPLSKLCDETSQGTNSTYTPTSSANKITTIVLLFLFIGLGFGTGFAIVIVWPIIKRMYEEWRSNHSG